ncbi:tail tube protein [Escherichia phage vB_EcoM_ESCO49]|uniref:Tail tube protein n=1 Tax=Escherichia phage vB_EcoM_ESCO49 TaxID=2918871 RepID=A0AAE9HPN2_9CAUD|nr:tail tube protein [Escherichia phage vB_EcoM_ESCO49]
MLMTGVTAIIAIFALYKAYKAYNLADKAITQQVNNSLVMSFLERLSDEQIKRLEMSFRFKARTYQISDIFKDDFQLVDDYNSLINALNTSDLKDYYAVIAQEMSKRKQNA